VVEKSYRCGNAKAKEAKRARRMKMRHSKTYAKKVKKSSKVKVFTRKEIAVYQESVNPN